MGKKEQIADLAAKYFSSDRALAIIRSLDAHFQNENQVLFYQIVQEANEIKLELAITQGQGTAIWDLVYRATSFQLCAMRYDEISFISFTEDEKMTNLQISSSGNPFLTYTSIAPQSREMLKQYYQYVLSMHLRVRG